jgi:hypothetical protein
MGVIKTYLNLLVRSTTSLDFYLHLRERPFRSSLKFFLASLMLVGLVGGLYQTKTLLFPLKDLLVVLPNKLADIYPADLTIYIKGGNLSINQTEPYYIPLEQFDNFLNDLKHQIKGVTTARPTYFMVIDTSASLDEFYSYQTFMLLTKNNLIYFNQAGHAEVVPLGNLTDTTISRQAINIVLSKVTPALKSLWLGLVAVFIIAATIFIPLLVFIQVVFYTLLSFPIAYLLRLKLPFVKLLQINLHLFVPFAFMIGLLSLAGLNHPLVDLSYPILFLVDIILLLTLKERSLTEVKLPEPGSGPQ